MNFDLHPGFTGDVYVVYNPADSAYTGETGMGSRNIGISPAGLARTAFPAPLAAYAFERLEFTCNGHPLPFFLDDLQDDKYRQHEDLFDSLCVEIYGFNQVDRKIINKIFHETIPGNVLMFQVDTLRNLLRNEDNF